VTSEEEEMKRGLIVYLTDSDAIPDGFEPEEAVAGLAPPCDVAVVAASSAGFFGIPEAWHLLLTRGMQQISCVKARLNDLGQLELFGAPLRLCG
jgi:hypothetical protein